MMGESNPQPRFYYNISLESFVPEDHPLRRIRPLIDHAAIQRECRPLYSDRGRPSIPPERLFLALVGGYLLGITSERRLVMEPQCNMALRRRLPQGKRWREQEPQRNFQQQSRRDQEVRAVEDCLQQFREPAGKPIRAARAR